MSSETEAQSLDATRSERQAIISEPPNPSMGQSVASSSTLSADQSSSAQHPSRDRGTSSPRTTEPDSERTTPPPANPSEDQSVANGTNLSFGKTSGTQQPAQEHGELEPPTKRLGGQVTILEDRDGWEKIWKVMFRYDKKIAEDWNTQVDSLLVFAGLFSAVVTAFNVEIFKRLIPNSPERVLEDISTELSCTNMSTPNCSAQNSTAPTQFVPATRDVAISVFWYLSLVFSLMAASLAIAVKEWLRRYATADLSAPQERLRVRQHRYNGIHHWKSWFPGVLGLKEIVPLLLRWSFALFLVGLDLFLWDLHPHHRVFIPVMLPSGIWMLGYLIFCLIPVFDQQCPYKSLESTAISSLIRVRTRTWRTWKKEDEEYRTKANMDYDILITASHMFGDSKLYPALSACAKTIDKQTVMRFVELHVPILRPPPGEPYIGLSPEDLRQLFLTTTKKVLIVLVQMVIDCVDRDLTANQTPTGSLDWEREPENRLIMRRYAFVAYTLHYADLDADSIDEDSCRTLFKILSQLPSSAALVVDTKLTLLSTYPLLFHLCSISDLESLCGAFSDTKFEGDFIRLIGSLRAILSLACALKLRFLDTAWFQAFLLASSNILRIRFGDLDVTNSAMTKTARDCVNTCVQKATQLGQTPGEKGHLNGLVAELRKIQGVLGADQRLGESEWGESLSKGSESPSESEYDD